MPLGPFLGAVEARLGEMTVGQLRKAVLGWARQLGPADRSAFLERLGAKVEAPRDRSERLLESLALLEEEAAATGEPEWSKADEWRDRYGWSLDEEQFVEPEWAGTFRELVREAGAVFLGGDVAAAAEAYGRLFRIAESVSEMGWALASDPDEVDALADAAARYLRAVGDVYRSPERPARLGEAVGRVSGALVAADSVSFAAIEAASDSPVEDRDALAADWEAALAPLTPRRDHLGEWAHRLYVEVVAAARGPEGVGELARAGGPRAGQIFIAWSDLAVGSGDLTEAAVAARQGVATLKPGWERAALADRLAILADNAGDLAEAVAARVEAWLSAPSLGRLLSAVDAGRRAGTETQTLSAMAPSRGGSLESAARAVMQILTGRIDKVAGTKPLPRRQDLTGRFGRWEQIAAPALLIAGSDATRSGRFGGTMLEDLVRSAEDALWSPFSRTSLVGEDYEALFEPSHDLELGQLLLEALDRAELTEHKRRQLLAEGRKLVEGYIAEIVGNKVRQAYRRAADLAVAEAEAIAIRDGDTAGQEVTDGAAARYPRHVAYQRELETARRRSPLVLTRLPR